MDCREVVASPSLKIFRALEDEQCDLNGPALSRRKDEMTFRVPTQSKLSYDLLILGVVPELRVPVIPVGSTTEKMWTPLSYLVCHVSCSCADTQLRGLYDIYRCQNLEFVHRSAILHACIWDYYWLRHETEVVQEIITSPGKSCSLSDIGQLKVVF